MPAPEPPSAPAPSDLARLWTGRLAPYRLHHHDEHREALLAEAARFVGLHLEHALGRSEFWSRAPLRRRVAVLLYLVDRGAVDRTLHQGRHVYEPTPGAETWAAAQPSLAPYLLPTLELLAALRDHQARRFLAAE
jgi:hypothetical protein